MIKWFVYIVLFLILMPCLSIAKIRPDGYDMLTKHDIASAASIVAGTDTTSKKARQKQQELDEKKKIKEITKAKRLPKPEKVDEPGNSSPPANVKPKRQRRPPGMERPPEIPRRNGN